MHALLELSHLIPTPQLTNSTHEDDSFSIYFYAHQLHFTILKVFILDI